MRLRNSRFCKEKQRIRVSKRRKTRIPVRKKRKGRRESSLKKNSTKLWRGTKLWQRNTKKISHRKLLLPMNRTTLRSNRAPKSCCENMSKSKRRKGSWWKWKIVWNRQSMKQRIRLKTKSFWSLWWVNKSRSLNRISSKSRLGWMKLCRTKLLTISLIIIISTEFYQKSRKGSSSMKKGSKQNPGLLNKLTNTKTRVKNCRNKNHG